MLSVRTREKVTCPTVTKIAVAKHAIAVRARNAPLVRLQRRLTVVSELCSVNLWGFMRNSCVGSADESGQVLIVERARICVLLTEALIVLRKFAPGFPELTIRMLRNRPVESPTGEAKVPVEAEPMTVMVPEHVEVAMSHDPLTQASKVSDGSFVLPVELATVVTVND